ncbi:NAD-dependent protein deacetylase sirtuin-7 [Amphibalanus amphitrite]|uniref:protein acetyllysine N-acetyltransferase n=1 Tax=Amphibalanus amphitrite TaxID=1232801 RepID=A0A6A4WM34_AMPAM|nr:NAD-dependent protein deacetylase sirtuin-7 [Amphibalanus amphitrite]
MADTEAPRATRKRKRATLRDEDKEKEEEKNLIKELTAILKKTRDQRTDSDRELLRKHPDHVIHIQKRLEKYRSRKARQEEYEEPESVIADKSAALAEAIRSARHLVVYTGAGVSTSASIPDYRGPDGIWTRLSQGRGIGQHDLTSADPTVTHMALYGLWQRGLVRHVVSQNCDGLHLRSGLPKRHMSELHGNMYLEVCVSCPRQYVRSFDVTSKTSRQNHKTGRRCYECATPLIDTVVHFGERGSLRWPLNWRGACRQARRSDVILCLGSSLKVLRKYSGLWCMHRPPHKRPRLFIVNLQWTPKDDCAALKINGHSCDDVSDVTCAVTELRDALVQTDPIEWREEEFTVVEELEEVLCSSAADSCSSGSEPGHSPDGRCSDLSHIRLMDGDRSPFCLSDDCLDRLSSSDVIFIDVPAAPPRLLDHDYSRSEIGDEHTNDVTEEDEGGDGGMNDSIPVKEEGESRESTDDSVPCHLPSESESESGNVRRRRESDRSAGVGDREM